MGEGSPLILIRAYGQSTGNEGLEEKLTLLFPIQRYFSAQPQPPSPPAPPPCLTCLALSSQSLDHSKSGGSKWTDIMKTVYHTACHHCSKRVSSELPLSLNSTCRVLSEGGEEKVNKTDLP